jgi:hypothetical protein
LDKGWGLSQHQLRPQDSVSKRLICWPNGADRALDALYEKRKGTNYRQKKSRKLTVKSEK